MSTLWLTIAYLAIAGFCWVKWYKWYYKHQVTQYPANGFDDADRIFGVLYGAFISLCWPIFLPCVGLLWLASKSGPLFAKVSFLRRLETLPDDED